MSAPHSPPRTAAFVRVEEVLLPARDVLATLYAVAQAPGVGGRLSRSLALAASLPALGVLRWRDRQKARRLVCMHARGMSADRLEVLTDEANERLHTQDLRPEGQRILERVRGQGHDLVLVTAGLARAMEPLARRLEASGLIGSRFELRDGVATGRLLEPWREETPAECARRLGVDLRGSYAYGVDGVDLPLLRAVGFPCAVNPDATLQRAADAESWPVVESR